MKFRYYITDLIDGVVKGTDKKEVAEDFRESEEHFVVDTSTGKRLMPGKEVNIREV